MRTLDLSPTVDATVKELAEQESVTAAKFVNTLFRRHPEYADNRAATLRLEDATEMTSRHVRDWMDAIRAALSPEDVDILHGRLAVVGLSIADPSVGHALHGEGILAALESEIKGPLERVLQPTAYDLWQRLTAPAGREATDAPESTIQSTSEVPAPEVESGSDVFESETVSSDVLESEAAKSDVEAQRMSVDDDSAEADTANGRDAPPRAPSLQEAVPTHHDHPAEIDELGRRPFAKVIATRMQEVWNGRGDEAFMLHIHGRWGSGKTSVLNFLRDELRSGRMGDRWVVVEFNAWRYQRLAPPWWALITAVYRQASNQIGDEDSERAFRLKLRWFWWRFRADWIPGVVTALLLAGAIWMFAGVPDQGPKIIIGFFTAAAAVYTFSRTLMFGSGSAAKTYTEMRTDPMSPIVKLFGRLVGGIGRPVAIFVDDLDRCNASYVVELLEGIQTLFRNAPVTYVVAADRNWIRSSFDRSYDSFSNTIGEPGRPLGYLFLEKVFQFSATVPQLSPDSRRAYWERLLQKSRVADLKDYQKKMEEAEVEAEQLMGEAHTGDELQKIIERHRDDPVLEQGLRAIAAKRITSPEAREEATHLLQPFSPLLEPNPRAMKRLVNAFGLHQAVNFLEGRPTATEPLALWTIIELRWPILADYLAADPSRVNRILDGTAPTEEGLAEEIGTLLQRDSVRSVVRGLRDDGGTILDENTLRTVIGLTDKQADAGLR